MDYSIGIRLKAFRLRTGIKMSEVEKATGISKHNLYKWEKGSIPRHSDEFIKLQDYLDKMEQEFPESETVYEPKRTATIRLPLDPKKVAVSQVSGKAASGTVIVENETPELIVDRIDAPCLGEVEGLVEITSESMEPTFSKGSRIAIRRLKNPRLLDWGECYYLIDKNWHGSLKRIYPGETSNLIELVSDNPDRTKYPSFQREWDQIETICKVKAEIKRC